MLLRARILQSYFPLPFRAWRRFVNSATRESKGCELFLLFFEAPKFQNHGHLVSNLEPRKHRIRISEFWRHGLLLLGPGRSAFSLQMLVVWRINKSKATILWFWSEWRWASTRSFATFVSLVLRAPASRPSSIPSKQTDVIVESLGRKFVSFSFWIQNGWTTWSFVPVPRIRRRSCTCEAGASSQNASSFAARAEVHGFHWAWSQSRVSSRSLQTREDACSTGTQF